MVNNNHFGTVVETLFKGMDHFVTTKTVVGGTVKIDDAIILPLVDMIYGMASGTFAENSKNRGDGGTSTRMSPSVILVIQNSSTRLMSTKNQNTVNKMLDMMSDIINKFTSGKVTVGEEFSADAVKAVEEMASAEVEKTE